MTNTVSLLLSQTYTKKDTLAAQQQTWSVPDGQVALAGRPSPRAAHGGIVVDAVVAVIAVIVVLARRTVTSRAESRPLRCCDNPVGAMRRSVLAAPRRDATQRSTRLVKYLRPNPRTANARCRVRVPATCTCAFTVYFSCWGGGEACSRSEIPAPLPLYTQPEVNNMFRTARHTPYPPPLGSLALSTSPSLPIYLSLSSRLARGACMPLCFRRSRAKAIWEPWMLGGSRSPGSHSPPPPTKLQGGQPGERWQV